MLTCWWFACYCLCLAIRQREIRAGCGFFADADVGRVVPDAALQFVRHVVYNVEIARLGCAAAAVGAAVEGGLTCYLARVLGLVVGG